MTPALGIIFASFAMFWTGIYAQWPLVIGLSLWAGGLIWKRVHWTAGLYTGYVLALGGVALSPWYWARSATVLYKNEYVLLSEIDRYALISQNISALFLGLIACFCFSSLWLKRPAEKGIEHTFALLAFANGFLLIAQSFCGADPAKVYGFLCNPSMSGCFMGCVFPIVDRAVGRIFSPNKFITLSLVLWFSFVIYLTKATIPIAVFGMVAGFYLWEVFGAIIAGIILTAASVYAKHIQIIYSSDSGRFEIWKTFMRFWRNKDGHWVHFEGFYPQHWIGFGPGTTKIMGPHMQFAENYLGGGYLWQILHNDFIQILFEQGAIGFGLFCLMLAVAGYRFFQTNKVYFASFIGFVITMTFNFPLHVGPFIFFGMFLLMSAFWKEDNGQ